MGETRKSKRTKSLVRLLIILVSVGLSALLPLHVLPVHGVTWSSPTQVPANTVFNNRPSTTQDPQGNFWLVYESAPSNVKPQSYYKVFNGFAWTSEQNITVTTSSNTSPSILTLSNGTLFVAWVTNRTGYQQVWFKTNNRGAWSSDKQLTTSTLVSPSGDDAPSAVQDLNGKIWVFYHRVVGSTADIFYRVFIPGAGWASEAQLTTDPSPDILPSATLTSDGRIWVAWSSLRTGNYQIWYKTFNGTTWTPDTRLTSYNLDDQDPAIVQSRDGTIWVVWAREIRVTSTFFETDLYYKNSTNMGATWSADTALTSTQNFYDFAPSLLQGTDKRLYVFWSSDMPASTNFNIFYQSTPILIHDVAVTNITASPQKLYAGGMKSISQSPLVSINTTITDLGDFTETVQLTLYANSTVISSQSVALAPTQTLTVASNWDTTGQKGGCWLVKAVLATVPGEINTANNARVWGYVHLFWPGDVNADGVVNIIDASILALAYGSTPGSLHWVPTADINGNGIVDIIDAGVLAFNYGKTTPNC